MARQAPAHGRSAAIFAAAFVALVVVLTLLDHFGLPPAALAMTLGGALLVAFAGLGINSGTLQASEFYLAGRSVPPALNGMASAAAVTGSLLFIGIAGTYFADPRTAVALILGWALGFLILTVAIAPYFRKSAAFGVVDFLGIRYGGRAVRVAAVAVVAAALLTALIASLAAAAFASRLLLDLSHSVALIIVTAIVIATTALGGLRGVTRVAIAACVVFAIAFIVPIAFVSLSEYGFPIPGFTFGYAAKEAALLAIASGKDIAGPIAGHFSTDAAGGFGTLATMLVLAGGVAALPHLVMRSATVRGPYRARRSAVWALAVVLAIALTAPAYATFSRLVILRELVDTPLENLPDWVFIFGGLGLVKVCGVAATSVDAVLGACSGLPGFTGNLNAPDLAIGSDAIVLAGPSILGLPYASTALVAAGLLAAALAAAQAVAFALASAVGHDLYAGAIDTRASAGRQLIVTRVVAVLAALLAAWFASSAGEDAFALAPIALSLSAGGLFPALILAIWWRRANAYGALAGIIAGGVLTAALIADHHLPGFLPFGRLGLDNLTAAIVGMPVGFLAVVAASLATDPPPEERMVTIEAIRRPGGTPFVQETESL